MLEAKQPEYMTWDLDRLQKEYFSQSLKYHAARMQLNALELKEEKIDRFLDAFNDLRGEVE